MQPNESTTLCCAEIAEAMVKAGEGSMPDDFEAFATASSRPGDAPAWVAYVRSKMFQPPIQAKL